MSKNNSIHTCALLICVNTEVPFLVDFRFHACGALTYFLPGHESLAVNVRAWWPTPSSDPPALAVLKRIYILLVTRLAAR